MVLGSWGRTSAVPTELAENGSSSPCEKDASRQILLPRAFACGTREAHARGQSIACEHLRQQLVKKRREFRTVTGYGHNQIDPLPLSFEILNVPFGWVVIPDPQQLDVCGTTGFDYLCTGQCSMFSVDDDAAGRNIAEYVDDVVSMTNSLGQLSKVETGRYCRWVEALVYSASVWTSSSN